MAFDPTETLLAFGHGDYTIKVFDVEKNYTTHLFEEHTGKINLLKFHPKKGELLLYSTSIDGLRVWDLEKRR
jgi:U3 small nucleolar RNA-associated protein 13